MRLQHPVHTTFDNDWAEFDTSVVMITSSNDECKFSPLSREAWQCAGELNLILAKLVMSFSGSGNSHVLSSMFCSTLLLTFVYFRFLYWY